MITAIVDVDCRCLFKISHKCLKGEAATDFSELPRVALNNDGFAKLARKHPAYVEILLGFCQPQGEPVSSHPINMDER